MSSLKIFFNKKKIFNFYSKVYKKNCIFYIFYTSYYIILKNKQIYDSMALRYIIYFVHECAHLLHIVRVANKCINVFLNEQINKFLYAPGRITIKFVLHKTKFASYFSPFFHFIYV